MNALLPLLLFLAAGQEPALPATTVGLIEAGKTYPGARVCESAPHALLMELAIAHAAHQADRRTQGHQQFQARWEKINAAGLGSAAEICAESWPWQDGQTPEQLGEEMFRCWRQSRGHWSVASTKHRYFGAGMARGKNGVFLTRGDRIERELVESGGCQPSRPR